MNPLDSAETIDGLRVWRAADGESWLFVPAAPEPMTGGDGRPQVSLIAAGETGFLSVGARLAASDERVAGVARQLAARAPGGDAPRLAMAPLTVRGARLVLTREGTARDLARATPSPLPPFQAAFQAMLAGSDGEAVRRAVDGAGPERLSVVYDVALAIETRAAARLSGDPSKLLAGLGEDDDFKSLLRRAVGDGRLPLTVEADPGAPPELTARVRDEAIDRAAETLARLHAVGGPEAGQGELLAETARSMPGRIETSLSADLAAWLRQRPP